MLHVLTVTQRQAEAEHGLEGRQVQCKDKIMSRPRPWIQGKIGFQDSVQVFFFGSQIRHDFIDLSNDGSKKGGST